MQGLGNNVLIAITIKEKAVNVMKKVVNRADLIASI
jgi:hypothetical protein